MAFVRVNPGDPIQAVNLDQVIDALSGAASKGQPIALTALNDSSNYALTVQNDDTTNSRALLVLNSGGSPLIRVDVTGVTLGSPLILPAGSVTSAYIQAGTIVSSNIATGGVQTGNIAANSVSQSAVYAASRGGTTTSATAVALSPAASVTLTTTGGPVLLWANVPWYNSSTNAITTISVQRDSGSFTAVATDTAPTANSPMTSGGWFMDQPAAGSHTWQIGWSTNAGTATVTTGALTELIAEELIR